MTYMVAIELEEGMKSVKYKIEMNHYGELIDKIKALGIGYSEKEEYPKIIMVRKEIV